MNNEEPAQKPSSEYAAQRASRSNHRRLVLVFFAVFAAVFAASLLYTFSRPKVYEAEARVARFELSELFPGGAEPLIPEIIYDNVASRIQNSREPERLYPPSVINNPSLLTRRLKENTASVSLDAINRVGLRVRHTDPQSAASIANTLADECIAHDARLRIDKFMTRVREMDSVRAAQQQKIEVLKARLSLLLNNADVAASAQNISERREIEERIRTHQTEHDGLIEQIRELTRPDGNGLDMSSVRYVERVTVPAAGDHFRPHSSRDLGLGASVALLSALGACLFVRQKQRSV